MFREICPDCIYEERIYSEEGEVHRSSRCYPGPFNRTCPKCRAGWRKSGLLGAPNFISMSLFVFGVVGLTHARLVSCGSCGGLNRCRNLRGDPTPAFCTHCGGQGRVTIWTWATS
jgi:hypothetical protein